MKPFTSMRAATYDPETGIETPVTPTPETEVAHVLMRAGFTRSEDIALDVARSLVLTVRHPELRWDIDDDHLTPEHRAILAAEEPR